MSRLNVAVEAVAVEAEAVVLDFREVGQVEQVEAEQVDSAEMEQPVVAVFRPGRMEVRVRGEPERHRSVQQIVAR